MPSASERLLTRTPGRTTVLFPALVTRSDSTGVWCTPEGGDPTRPIGPCRGATWPVLVADGGGGYSQAIQRLPEKTRVLVLQLPSTGDTDEPPWVVAYDREVSA